MALLATLTLVSCGKKGPPSPPGPANEITWPRTYPTY
jgi:predicted small lipoprotein YifL